MDTGALGKVQGETIRLLVWLLSFLSFGYATQEFEVTSDRLGVYRPEEHIDNPKDYNDNKDARSFDQRLRGPVREIELQIDPETGMKNYIANEKGDWATSAAFVRWSFTRSIQHGRSYHNAGGFFHGKDEELAEALRCLGQGLHTLEDFGAHTNYTELVLRELGFNNVFPHCGANTQINLRGHHVFPLVTGTFGTVDFLHSVLGEATDHFAQSEVNEMDNALGTAQTAAQSNNPLMTLVKLLAKVPGTRELCEEAEQLQRSADAQAYQNSQPSQQHWGPESGWQDIGQQPQQFGATGGAPEWNQNYPAPQWQGGPQDNWGQQPPQQGWGPPPYGWPQPQQWKQQPEGSNQLSATQSQSLEPTADRPAPGIPLPNIDPEKVIQQIYPILVFRDKVVRTVSSIIEKIPGLEALIERITETLTIFVMSLLAPFVRPVISVVEKSLQSGSSQVLNSSAQHQYEPWTDPNCDNPTHSFLSKDHFSNILNEPAGHVAAEILKYVAPRVLHAWQDPSTPVERVMDDVMKVFHHPILRDNNIEVHRTMFAAVKSWVDSRPDRGATLNDVLSSEGVKSGKNSKAGPEHTGHTHNQIPQLPQNVHALGDMGLPFGGGQQQQPPHHSSGGWSLPGFSSQQQYHQQQSSSNPLELLSHLPIPGLQSIANDINKYSKYSNFIPGFGKRELDNSDMAREPGTEGMQQQQQQQPPPFSQQGPSTEYPGYGGSSSGGAGYYGGSGPGGQTDEYYRRE